MARDEDLIVGAQKDENIGETARAWGLRSVSPEEPSEKTYGELRAKNAQYRDEAFRLREECDGLRAQNTQLRKRDGGFRRRIRELRSEFESFEARLRELRETSGSLGADLASVRNENRALNTTITRLSKENKSLDMAATESKEQHRSLTMTLVGLRKDNRSLNTATSRSQEEGRFLNGRVRELSAENEYLKRQNQDQCSRVAQLEQDLREVQEREYAATKQENIESHEVVSARFENLFRRCESWARRYFKLGVKDFRIEEFPPFAQELELVLWSDTNWKDKKYFKLSHLVQAVLGNILVRKVFECPFAGCSRDFRREFLDLFEVKLRGTINQPTAGYG